MLDPFFLRYWYYLIPTYILAALAWTLIGRFVLGFFVAEDSPNYIMRFFRRLTDPVIRLLAPVTPGFLHPLFIPLYAAFWMFALRVAFHIALVLMGAAPELAPYLQAPPQTVQ